jgi:hypothetical protein
MATVVAPQVLPQPKKNPRKKKSKLITVPIEAPNTPPVTTPPVTTERPKKRRAPSAYGGHMRSWMAGYKGSGFTGTTKEYFALGARGWKSQKPEVTEKKKAKPAKI